jgi:hypothetical protein
MQTFFSAVAEMRQLIEIAGELQEVCDSKRWRSCVIGGLAVQRCTFEFLLGAGIRTCSAEDLIVYKAFADRPRDWVDVKGILLRQHADVGATSFQIDP